MLSLLERTTSESSPLSFVTTSSPSRALSMMVGTFNTIRPIRANRLPGLSPRVVRQRDRPPRIRGATESETPEGHKRVLR